MHSLTAYLEKTLCAAQWKTIGIYPHHGICLPLFSLKTRKSSGIGDFGDLRLLIDWCCAVGFDCIQLLPLNDSGNDPSPYNALSSCALNPIYIDLHDLPHFQGDLSVFAPLNDQPRLEYLEVKRLKLHFLDQYFETAFHELSQTIEYQQFLEQNPWLASYANFKALKDEHHQSHWGEWPTHSPSNGNAVHFYCFLQFLAFTQLAKIKQYAEKKGIFLKGDIPILLSPDSADVWANRSLFNLNDSAGAPPDFYNLEGQKWGFPLYQWDEMRKNHFAWWKQRLQVAERLFHIYRIDHVVGFFRIWAIGAHEKPSEGRYVPEDPLQWGDLGREILEMMIQSSSMLPMAEDLGASIPAIVTQTLHEFGICGTKVMRWVRQLNGEWSDGSDYDPISLTTISTPDSEPLQLWWKVRPNEAAALASHQHWSYHPDLSLWQREEILKEAHHTASLFHINLLQEYLALVPSFCSQQPEDERINVPGTLLSTNWTYRFKPFLEEIVQRKELAEQIRQIIH